MNIVFFGTSEFAVPSLKKLIGTRHKILAVVTQPDRPKGRSVKPVMPPVKEIALKHYIKVLQPETLGPSFIEELKSLEPDLFVVIAYGQILKRKLFEIPKLYTINVHASLLPKYRGAAPINWTILNGENKTGISVIKMNEKMDEGDIISRKEIYIRPEDTSVSLSRKLSEAGADLLLVTHEMIKNKKVNFIKQNSRDATYARKLRKADGLIDWKRSAVEIQNQVRGLIPWPGAYTIYNNKILKIWKTQILEEHGIEPGRIVKADSIDLIVGTGKGAIKILELQQEAGKKMDISSFLQGHRIEVNTLFPLT